MPDHLLKLYVTGQTSTSRRAAANLRRICTEELGDRYRMVVVDLLDHPHLAEEGEILATPAAVSDTPLPVRKVIGDMSDPAKVIRGLDLTRGRDGAPLD